MSGLNKDLLVFDASNPNESDNVGAFLRGASGEIVTSTLSGGKQALDVNMVNAIDVEISAADGDSVIISDGVDNLAINNDGSLNAVVSATDLDIRDLTHVSDSVKIGDGTDFLAVNNDGSLNAVVSATDLDIRDLSFATDKVDVSGSSVSVSGDVNVTQGTSPWVVSATDLDIRDLSSASDSVAALGNVADDAVDSGNPVKVGSRALSGALAAVSASGDRADAISDLYRRIYVNDSPNISSASAAVSVTNSEIALAASPLAGRRRMIIENLSNAAIFVGPTGVSTSSGLRVAAGGSLSLEIGPDVALFAISATAAAKDVRVFQLA